MRNFNQTSEFFISSLMLKTYRGLLENALPSPPSETVESKISVGLYWFFTRRICLWSAMKAVLWVHEFSVWISVGPDRRAASCKLNDFQYNYSRLMKLPLDDVERAKGWKFVFLISEAISREKLGSEMKLLGLIFLDEWHDDVSWFSSIFELS